MSSSRIHCCYIILQKKNSEVTRSGPTLCDPWTVAHQASSSMGFSRQEYRSGLPFPSPGDLSDPGIEPRSPTLQADSLPLSHQFSSVQLLSRVQLFATP